MAALKTQEHVLNYLSRQSSFTDLFGLLAALVQAGSEDCLSLAFKVATQSTPAQFDSTDSLLDWCDKLLPLLVFQEHHLKSKSRYNSQLTYDKPNSSLYVFACKQIEDRFLKHQVTPH